MLWPTRSEHENGSVRPLRYCTLTEYEREVAASASGFSLVNESSDSCEDHEVFVCRNLNVIVVLQGRPSTAIAELRVTNFRRLIEEKRCVIY
ncbi:hypothetical protein EVAR_47507_1 [Eumeta japonica]|uniref:Uncharacterized protein n=1 Tax=Eumeta variegata TaxID=151549 RepID=A0A4C1XUW3_EUMVA|nr:hypothetical protein EVAR_47507_1 [Eumeta japonica]